MINLCFTSGGRLLLIGAFVGTVAMVFLLLPKPLGLEVDNPLAAESNRILLQGALENRKDILLPEGIIFLNPGIDLPAGTTIRGRGLRTLLQWTKSGPLFLLLSSEQSTTSVREFMAEGPPDSFLVLATSSASFDISKVSVFSAGLFTTKPDDQREYSAASPIRRIAECLAHGKGSKIAGINLRFVCGVVVQGNFIDGYRHGVTIWGGESNPAKPTFISSLWGSSNIVVTSNIICNPKMGGIWTSRAQSVRVCNNIVYNCGDVGLDAEGSREIIFSGNVVVNSRNGNLAVFFSSERVRFESNILLTTNSSWPQSRVYNSSLVAARHDGIAYDANVFVGLDPSGKPGRFDNASGPMKNTRISRNIFVDTQIDLARHGAEATQIDSNIMLFSRTASIPYPAVRLRNGDKKIVVSNNLFRAPSEFKTQAGVEKAGGVSVSSTLEEWGNIVEGFSCFTARTAGK